jgi:hypothetical protein
MVENIIQIDLLDDGWWEIHWLAYLVELDNWIG